VNKKKLWTIIICASFGIIVAVVMFCWFQFGGHTFTKPEYIREVVIQSKNFEGVMDDFLDQVDTYNGTEESDERIEYAAQKAAIFVENLRSLLGPKVPGDAREHFKNMMLAYDMYLESIDLYKEALPKPLGEERNNGIKKAGEKFAQARETMKSSTK
jgi:hypothetical protein